MLLRHLLRTRAFAVLYLAELQSIAGDQLARVALSVLVYARTNNAAATALTYATTFLPAIFGGMVLGGLGDRFSRRRVMVGCDLVRAAAFAAMALPPVPLPAVIALLISAIFVGPAHTAAQVSYLAQALEPEQFRAATGIRLATSQAAQVAGFALGGGIVAAASPRGALAIDAATFLLAAALVGTLLPGLRVRHGRAKGTSDGYAGMPASRRPDIAPVSAGRHRATEAVGGSTEPRARVRPSLRTVIALCWLQGFFVVPEGLAVPYGSMLGATTTQIGLLFASLPLGGVVGAVVLTRRVPPARRRPLSRLMAVLTGGPLVLTGLPLPLPAVLAAWAVSGALAAYQIELMTEIVQQIPSGERARIIGRISAGLISAQGLGLALFGGIAQLASAHQAVGWAGAAGLVLAGAFVLAERTNPKLGAEPVASGRGALRSTERR